MLEFRKKDMRFFDLVQKVILDLYPLRCERTGTEDYFNRYLFADVRCRVEENFELREGEVNPGDAYFVRLDILHVIEEDDSFTYAYNIISQSRNKYIQSDLLAMRPPKKEDNGTVARIKKLCAEYKEDYPKTLLSDYLLDENNRKFYDRKNDELGRGPEWWLDAFNRAYELFDKMRVQLNKPFQAEKLAMEPFTGDEELRHAVTGIVCSLLKHYCYGLSTRQKIKMSILYRQVRRFYNSRRRPSSAAGENEELQRELDAKNLELKQKDEIIARQDETIKQMREEAEKHNEDEGEGLTVNQLALAFYYLFDALEINFANSDKTQWARFIHQVTGKSYHRIRNALSIDFESKTTRKNLRVVASLFAELFPQIHKKILNDMRPLE